MVSSVVIFNLPCSGSSKFSTVGHITDASEAKEFIRAEVRQLDSLCLLMSRPVRSDAENRIGVGVPSSKVFPKPFTARRLGGAGSLAEWMLEQAMTFWVSSVRTRYVRMSP